MTDLLTPRDLAARLGKTADYWQRKAARREIPHRRIGRDVRFTEADVDAILAASLIAPVDVLAAQTPGSRARGRRRTA